MRGRELERFVEAFCDCPFAHAREAIEEEENGSVSCVSRDVLRVVELYKDLKAGEGARISHCFTQA